MCATRFTACRAESHRRGSHRAGRDVRNCGTELGENLAPVQAGDSRKTSRRDGRHGQCTGATVSGTEARPHHPGRRTDRAELPERAKVPLSLTTEFFFKPTKGIEN